MDTEDHTHRRAVLKALGAASILGVGAGTNLAGSGHGSGRGGNDAAAPPGREPDATGERRIVWDGQRGSENARQNCPERAGCWDWVLTPGGPEEFSAVGDLRVTYGDGSEGRATGEQRGQGAYQFRICKAGGGTIEDAFVEVEGGGDNALLTISDGECDEITYWQVDFGAGEEPPRPPRYFPDDFIAALGNSVDGVTENPSAGRADQDDQLGGLTVTSENSNGDFGFEFDDTADPDTATVRFEVDAGGAERDLHFAVFTLPEPFDNEVEDQDLYGYESASFGGGEAGELTVELPDA